MNNITENAFKTQISSLTGTAFQLFIDKLYTLAYGEQFTVVKQKHDKGCDGILNNNTILAAHAPEKYDFNKIRRKLVHDFEGYSNNWASAYPNWQVIYNGVFTASMIQVLDSLKPGIQKVGQPYLIEIIGGLRWSQIQEIAEYLNIDTSYIIFDVIDEIVNDLLKAKPDLRGEFDFAKRTKLDQKIELNFSIEDVEAAKSEFVDTLKYFWLVKNVISGYEQEEDVLKNRVRSDLAKLSGDFKTKLGNLTEMYTQNRQNDDYYKLFVRILLLYLFEQCIIGQSK